MLLLLSLVIIALGLIGYYFHKSSEKSIARLKKALDENTNISLFQSQFKCMVIIPCAHCCKKAREQQSKPILASNLPTLPLPDCDAMACECTFLPQDDRRKGLERRIKQDEKRIATYTNNRIFRDRRRTNIQEYMIPQYRTFN